MGFIIRAGGTGFGRQCFAYSNEAKNARWMFPLRKISALNRQSSMQRRMARAKRHV